MWKRERERRGEFQMHTSNSSRSLPGECQNSHVWKINQTQIKAFFKKIPISNQILRLAAQSEKALFGGDDPAGCIYSDINPAEVLPAAA